MAKANTDITTAARTTTSDASFYALIAACREAWRACWDAPDGGSGHLCARARDLEREIIETGVTTAQALTAKIKFIRAVQRDARDLDRILECLERDAERIARGEARRDGIAGIII
jgi:hypothetical protein